MIKNVAEKTGPKPETEKYRRQSRDKENSFHQRRYIYLQSEKRKRPRPGILRQLSQVNRQKRKYTGRKEGQHTGQKNSTCK